MVHSGVGGTPLVAEDGQAWDAVVLVRHPSRQALCRTVADPGHQGVTALRGEALAEAVPQPTAPGPAAG